MTELNFWGEPFLRRCLLRTKRRRGIPAAFFLGYQLPVWEQAEKILLNAARQVTKDVIAFTGRQPYIRSDMSEYGVHLRLRYYTWSKERAETTYKINKVIFEDIQNTPSVDLAIPYVYSFRSAQLKNEFDESKMPIENIEIAKIMCKGDPVPMADLKPLIADVMTNGLLQPIVVRKRPDDDRYEIMAGSLRLQACQSLGWKYIPAIVYKGKSSGIIEPTAEDVLL